MSGIRPGARLVASLALALCLIAPSAFAQITTATLSGLVKDSSGAVTLAGFKTLERPGLVVHAGDKINLGTLGIEVGALEETVTVAYTFPFGPTRNVL